MSTPYEDHLDALLLKAHLSGSVVPPQSVAAVVVKRAERIVVAARKNRARGSVDVSASAVSPRLVPAHGWIINEQGVAYVGGCIAEWVLFLANRYPLTALSISISDVK